jgi:hypothetical protein
MTSTIAAELRDLSGVRLAELPEVADLKDQVVRVREIVLRGRTSVSGYNGAGKDDE